MVYVLANNGQPLMPTERHGKVRRMLKSGQATVVRRCPFTIQLNFETTDYVQPVEVGQDAGSRTIGVSATTKTRVLFEAEVTVRNDIVELMSTRRENRRSRRSRKTRYRKPRFDNRKRSDRWLAPSIRNKIGTHISVLEFVCSILPVSSITIETAAFDLQKLKADWQGLEAPEGEECQKGEQYGFWNAREYVLFRDSHTCQCCKGKSRDKILNVHHIESRKTGGDAPNNLITLCETCHKGYHNGTVKLPKTIKRGMSFKDATFMGVMRWALYDKIKEMYIPKGIEVHMTYGYMTKNTRITHGLDKTHYIDARCISGNPEAKPASEVFIQRKVRCHNRQIHKNTILKGGYRKPNQAPYEIKGFRLFDKVSYQGKTYFVFGRRSSGFMDIRTLDGTKVNNGSVSYRKLKFIGSTHGMLVERHVVA